MSFTSAALASEINTDPKALGYAAPKASGADGAVAAILNATYAGVGTVYRRNIAPHEIEECLVYAELGSLTVQQWQLFQTVLEAGVIDASKATIQNILIGMFPNTTTTYANLVAVAKTPNPTRAEELWGQGTVVTVADVAHALRG